MSKNTKVIRITDNHTGKMKDFASLSTSPFQNKHCEERAKVQGSVCEKCFSRKTNKIRKTLERKLATNGELLSGSILSDEDFPIINTATRIYKYFRLEAFGDLINETHFINYVRFCELNPETRFTLWTKNLFIIEKVLESGYEKPENLTIIFSSPMLNKSVFEAIKSIYPFVDKVFTVYDKRTVKEQNININCGSRACASCLKCYAKNTVSEINELLK